MDSKVLSRHLRRASSVCDRRVQSVRYNRSAVSQRAGQSRTSAKCLSDSSDNFNAVVPRGTAGYTAFVCASDIFGAGDFIRTVYVPFGLTAEPSHACACVKEGKVMSW